MFKSIVDCFHLSMKICITLRFPPKQWEDVDNRKLSRGTYGDAYLVARFFTVTGILIGIPRL